MKSINKSAVILLGIGFVFILSFTFNDLMFFKEANYRTVDIEIHLKTSTNSDKIHINNNWTDTRLAGICSGEGTASIPYLIKDLVIDAGGIGHGIFIENTTEYFKIENCTLYNSGLDFHDAGIKLNITQNGVLINNTTYDNSQGMSIYASTNLKIIKNRFFGSYGIELFFTNNSLLYLNTFENDVITVFFYYSYNQYNSEEMYTYTYQGKTFTNYLGNYWSDYTGLDQNNDGIGDSAVHVISHFHSATLTDNYPLMEPIHNFQLNVSEGIPGYSLLFLILILSTFSLILIRKLKRNIKSN